MSTNDVLGLCPLCNNPQNSVFMQSIQSDSLFGMLMKRGNFKRDFLFCTPCIKSAKSEVLKVRGPIRLQICPISPVSKAGVSRQTQDSFAVDTFSQPMVQSDDFNVGQVNNL